MTLVYITLQAIFSGVWLGCSTLLLRKDKLIMSQVIEEETVSLARMCEVILEARILNKRLKTGKQIYNYSPTGELHMIFQWYFTARGFLADIQKKYYHYGASSDSDPCMYCGKPVELQSRTKDLSTEICMEHKHIVQNGGSIDYFFFEFAELPPEREKIKEIMRAQGIDVL